MWVRSLISPLIMQMILTDQVNYAQHTQAHTPSLIQTQYTHVHTHMHVHTQTHIHTYTNVATYIHTHTYVYTHVYIQMYVYVHTHT